MKTNRIIMLAALAAATVAFSCTKVENDIENNNTPSGEETVKPAPELVTITAYLPESQDETKVTITESSTYDEAQLAWQENDQITLVDAANGTFVFGIDNSSISGNQAQFTQASPGTIGAAPYTIYYHPSKPLTLEKFNSLGHDGQVQDGNGSTAHLKYGVKLVGVDTYDSIEFSSEWASNHGSGSIQQNSVLQLLLRVPDGVEEVYSIYVESGNLAQTLWLNDGSNVFVAPNGKHVVKAYMMVPQLAAADMGTKITVRVETEDGAYEAAYDLTTSGWAGGAQYTIQKNMSSLSAVTGTDGKMQIHAACAQDILQFKAGVNASIARFRGSTVTLEKNIDMASAGSWAESITDFTGVFNGNNKTISDLLATAPLFNAIPTGAEVKDFTLEGDFRYTHPSGTNDNFGTVAKQLQGTLSGITVVATASLAAGNNKKLIDFGGLVGRANAASASISNCSFNGSITIPSTYSTSSSIRLGGIVGYTTKALTVQNCSFGGTIECSGGATVTTEPALNIGGIVGRNQKAKVKDCTTYDASSKPKVTINNTDYEASILVQSSTVYATIGGIVGWNIDSGSVSGCTNNSTIFDNITTSGEYILCAGGIVGFNDSTASLKESTNKAKTTHLSSPQTQYIGGVVGLDKGSYTGGKNEGAIDVMGSARYPRIGGVIGEKNDGTFSNADSDVVNEGSINVTAVEKNESTHPMIGGIIGHSTVAISGTSSKYISNVGEVCMSFNSSTQLDGYDIGGIVGCSTASVQYAKNSGYVHFVWDNTTDASSKIHLGGIVGIMDGNGTISNSNNIGSKNNAGTVYLQITAANIGHTDNYIGGILGYSTKDVAMSDCTNSGYIHGGNNKNDSPNYSGNGKTCFVGGIVAYLEGNSSLNNCDNSGEVFNRQRNNTDTNTESVYNGGIAGYIKGTSSNHITIQNCDNTAAANKIYSQRGFVGGVVGYAEYADFTSCSYNQNIAGSNLCHYIGGIAGWAANCTLTTCTYSGTSFDSTQTQANGGGGIAAKLENSTLDGCLSYVTSITKNGSTNIAGGGLIGIAIGTNTVKDCNWAATINGAAANNCYGKLETGATVSLSGTNGHTLP